MTEQELKLMKGNWVLLDNPTHRPSETGKYAKILQIRENDCSIQMIDDEYGINTFGQLNEFLKPIPLTSEILEKCPQFECTAIKWNDGSVSDVYIMKNNYYIEFNSSGACFCLFLGQQGNPIFLNFAEHLHTLQNLVSLLTNQELIVNL